MNKAIYKKTGEELQQYFYFKKRGFTVPNKKGKGSYDRKSLKKWNFDEA